MRGKLRDKRAETKRDVLKRDVTDRKRIKRNINAWLSQQLEEEEEDSLPIEDDETTIGNTTLAAQNGALAPQK